MVLQVSGGWRKQVAWGTLLSYMSNALGPPRLGLQEEEASGLGCGTPRLQTGVLGLAPSRLGHSKKSKERWDLSCPHLHADLWAKGHHALEQ